MTDHKALSFDTLTRLAIEAGLMEPRDTMSSVPAEYAGSICIFAELVAAEVRKKDADKLATLEAQLEAIGAGGVSGPLMGVAQAPAVPAVGGEKWQPMETAPKDGTVVRLLVEFEDNALNDEEGPQATIGSNTSNNTGESEPWQLAGWNWSHDCYTQGTGKPIGWLPLLLSAPQPEAQAPAVPAEPTYSIQDLRAARSEAYSAGVSSAVPKKVTADMRRVFREAFREGGFWADRLDYALDAMLAAAPQPEGVVDERALVMAKVQFLGWNRAQGADRPIFNSYEYFVCDKAVKLYVAALSAQGGV
jgi:hypothetical protein